MSKRTASKMRVNTTRSARVNVSLKTDKQGRKILRALDDYDIETKGFVATDLNDTSEIDLAYRHYNHKADTLTLLVPDCGNARDRAREFIKQHAKSKIRTRDGMREYALNAIPIGTPPPDGCKLVLGVVAPEGTGTDTHMKDTRSAQRRDYSAKKGPKRTFRNDGRPNDEDVGRPIQGDPELTPLNNRKAAREYWH